MAGMNPMFRRGVQESRGPFVADALPDEQKRDLCRSLLAEFGVTSVTERGDELIHSCCLPFGAHRNGDRNPSASLNYRKLTYNCLGCGNSGGLLWFVGVCRGDDSAQARGWLDQQMGLTEDEEGLANFLRFIDALYSPDSSSRRPAPVPKMDPGILDRWRRIHPYMTDPPPVGRGVPVETIKHFSVGYGEFRTNIGVEEDRWITSERIVIPHFWRGDLVGWQTRRLGNDGTPKYKSSPDMPKDSTIYNYDPRRPTAVVVESPMSVLSKHHLCPTMEATFGAKVTDRQVRLLAAHESAIILWFDNDDAGWKATRDVGDALSAYGPVYVVDSPWAADPADMDRETFLGLLANPVPYALWKPPAELRPWEHQEAVA